MALVIMTFFQLMIHCHAVVEHKHSPSRFRIPVLLRGTLNSTFQVIDLVKAMPLSSAVDFHSEYRRYSTWRLSCYGPDQDFHARSRNSRKDSVTGLIAFFELADLHLVVIRVSISTTSGSLIRRFQSERLNIGSDNMVRIDALDPHGHDLALEFDLGLVENGRVSSNDSFEAQTFKANHPFPARP